MTDPYKAIEAFARGAIAAMLSPCGDAPPARKARRRRAQLSKDAPAPSPRQLPLDLPIAPGVSVGEMPAPPLTQAQVEHMERVLRGEAPNGSYKPGEGVAPWMES